MDSFAVHPALWTDSPLDPAGAQALVAEALSIRQNGPAAVIVTERLQWELGDDDCLARLASRRHDPSLAGSGVLLDALLSSLYELIASARILDEVCEFQVASADFGLTSLASVPLRDAFIELMLHSTHDEDISDVVLAPATIAECKATVSKATCVVAPVTAMAALSSPVVASAAAWFARQPALHRSIRGNLLAALGTDPVDVEWSIHPAFERSLELLPDRRVGRVRQIFRGCATAIRRIPAELAAADDEPLRSAGKRYDGSEGRRLRIQQNAPAAMRLHYWYRPGHVTIARVSKHDDYSIAE